MHNNDCGKPAVAEEMLINNKVIRLAYTPVCHP